VEVYDRSGVIRNESNEKRKWNGRDLIWGNDEGQGVDC
jgi:hypothetical protein